MTAVREKLSLFQNNIDTSDGDRRKPPPPPKAGSTQHSPRASSSSPRLIRNGSAPSPSQGDAGSAREPGISKLSPALLKNLEKTSRGLSPGGPAVIKGGIAGARTPSPAPKKKAKSASKLPQQQGADRSRDKQELDPSRLGVGLLASVTRDISASTGNLDSHFSPSTASNKQISPNSVRGKSSSPQQKTRKAAAMSMDVSKVSPGVKDKSPRPFSTHRVSSHTPSGHLQDTAPPSLLIRSTSPSPLPRIRDGSIDSFEDSCSPPRLSPTPQSPSNNNSLSVSQPRTVVCRSTENLLESSGPGPTLTKPRSNSDAMPPLPGLETKRKPKPAPPPKKPGLAAMATKPAPPPKPHIKQLKKSPDFSRRISGGSSSPLAATSPLERHRSTSATSEPTFSPTLDKPRSFSPAAMAQSPSPAPLRQPSRARGEGTPVSSPLPSTPSPRSSQLEAVRRNADSGFASETADDPSSPLEAAVAVGNTHIADGNEGEAESGGDEVCQPPPEVWDEARVSRCVCVC